MAARGSLSGFHAYANEAVVPSLFSGIYQFPTLATALSLKGSTVGKLTPKSELVLGRKVTAAKAKDMAGSTQLHGFFQTGDINATKVVGTDDTGASAGSERVSTKKRSWYTSFAEYETAVAIENEKLDAAKGKYAVGSLIEDATQIAMASQLATLATDLYTGAPSDYTADVYDTAVAGLDAWLHNSNNAFGVDRSSVTGFNAQYATAAMKYTLSTIEDICSKGVAKAGGGTTDSLNSHGSRADVIIVPEDGYNKLKKEAISKQLGRAVSGDSLPKGGMVGYVSEYVDYCGKFIFPDPKAASGSMYILDSNAISIEFFAGKNFTVSPFVDLRKLQPGTGQPNTTNAALCTKIRTAVWEPWKCFRGTNFS